MVDIGIIYDTDSNSPKQGKHTWGLRNPPIILNNILSEGKELRLQVAEWNCDSGKWSQICCIFFCRFPTFPSPRPCQTLNLPLTVHPIVIFTAYSVWSTVAQFLYCTPSGGLFLWCFVNQMVGNKLAAIYINKHNLCMLLMFKGVNGSQGKAWGVNCCPGESRTVIRSLEESMGVKAI